MINQPKYTKLADNIHILELERPEDKVNTKNSITFTAGGAYFEKPELQGISHLLEHYIASQYNGINTEEFDRLIALKGIYKNASTGLDSVRTVVNGHKDDTKDIFDILFGMTFNIGKKEEILEQQRKIVTAELKEYLHNPKYELSKYKSKMIYVPESSIHIHIPGSEETVKRITLDDIFQRFQSMISESHIIFNFGHIGPERDEIIGRIKQTVDTLKLAKKLPIPVNFSPELKYNDFTYLPIIHKFAGESVDFEIRIPFTYDFKTAAARSLFVKIMSNSRYAILHNHLRTKLGLIYSVSSGFSKNPDDYSIRFSTETKNVKKAYETVLELINNDEILTTEKDFEARKEVMRKNEELSNETDLFSNLDYSADLLEVYGEFYTFEQFKEQLQKLTFADVLEIHEQVKKNLKNARIIAVTRNEKLKEVKL